MTVNQETQEAAAKREVCRTSSIHARMPDSFGCYSQQHTTRCSCSSLSDCTRLLTLLAQVVAGEEAAAAVKAAAAKAIKVSQRNAAPSLPVLGACHLYP